MYKIVCKKCGREFESSRSNRSVCDNCKVARNQMNMNFRNSAYDRVEVYLQKGQKEEIKTFLSELDISMSMNEFFRNAVMTYMEKLYNEHGNSDKTEE